MKLTITKSSVFLTLALIILALLNIYLLPEYIYGDQQHYRDFYKNIRGLSIKESYGLYKNSLGTQEPIYFFLVWISSNLGISKDALILAANLLLATYTFKAIVKIGAHPFIAFTFICFNFYFFVFYFSAERLKFSLLLLAILFVQNRFRIIYSLLAMLTHLQASMILLSFLAPALKRPFYDIFANFKVKLNSIFAIIGLVLIVSLLASILSNHIISKFNYYLQDNLNLLELLKTIVLFVLSLRYAEKKIDVCLSFIPIIILVLIFGGDRVNFISFLLFIYFSASYNRGFNLGIIITQIYFFYTGCRFLLNILEYGNGFV